MHVNTQREAKKGGKESENDRQRRRERVPGAAGGHCEGSQRPGVVDQVWQGSHALPAVVLVLPCDCVRVRWATTATAALDCCPKTGAAAPRCVVCLGDAHCCWGSLGAVEASPRARRESADRQGGAQSVMCVCVCVCVSECVQRQSKDAAPSLTMTNAVSPSSVSV